MRKIVMIHLPSRLDIRVFSAQAAETWRIVTLKKFRFDNLEPSSVKSMVFEYTMNSKIET
ncbi:hypothetical protein BRARA_H00643 [Brassica rapa]|uniref:Uncharacterized protein n=1 Tax=Brassica campestris TaxID=3711 RepID=A0A397YGR7_BRACM|nr:hypothetical protein BRARA_H00643 [Brassica rapa]